MGFTADLSKFIGEGDVGANMCFCVDLLPHGIAPNVVERAAKGKGNGCAPQYSDFNCHKIAKGAVLYAGKSAQGRFYLQTAFPVKSCTSHERRCKKAYTIDSSKIEL